MKMFNIKGKDSDKYFKEVEGKLLEETDYVLEVEQSIQITEACGHIPHIKFPKYYKDLSNERIITMDWMDGVHLSEFTKENTDLELANTLGQALWDFYMYQIHELRQVHADPHPGNFLVSDAGELITIDFGCIKKVPDSFYTPYFELAKPENIDNPAIFEEKLYALEILKEEDSEAEKVFFSKLFHEMLSLFTQPFHQEVFDFSDTTFLEKLPS
ncbi:unnamed protein product [Pylaiella littoralis]